MLAVTVASKAKCQRVEEIRNWLFFSLLGLLPTAGRAFRGTHAARQRCSQQKNKQNSLGHLYMSASVWNKATDAGARCMFLVVSPSQEGLRTRTSRRCV